MTQIGDHNAATIQINPPPLPFHSSQRLSNPMNPPTFPMPFSGDPLPTILTGTGDLQIPLQNLSTIHSRINAVQTFLSNNTERKIRINNQQSAAVSSEIATAIQQIIVNGAALIASAQVNTPDLTASTSQTHPISDEITGIKSEESERDCEVVELDAMELLAEHIHFCQICGKGFKRDANLRMHMRAHGNRFKTLEALAKPLDVDVTDHRANRLRFSCPYGGCVRNKSHQKFRALKSLICVKNHFKRSHCPKMFSCNRCNKKSFSVMADLKSHLKNCGESKWRCSCGTTFSRKDKLFGHMALFEGHMPAVVADDGGGKGKATAVMDEDRISDDADVLNGSDDECFRSFLDGFGSVENHCLQEVLGLSCNFDLESFGGFEVWD